MHYFVQVKLVVGKQPVKDTTNFEGLADLLKTPAKGRAPLSPTKSAKVDKKYTPRRKSVSGMPLITVYTRYGSEHLFSVRYGTYGIYNQGCGSALISSGSGSSILG
jgi:hypothetical protein